MSERSVNSVPRFTKTYVDKAQPGPIDPETKRVRPLLYWETATGGFGLRVGEGTKSFFVQRKIGGVSKRFTLGRYGVLTVEEARRKARKVLDKMGDGIDPKAERDAAVVKGMTLRDALALYCSDPKRNVKTSEASRGYLEKYLPKRWLDRPLAELGTDAGRKEINRLHKEIARDVAKGVHALSNVDGRKRPRKDRTGEATANQTMYAFRAVWNRAMRASAALPVSPTINVDWFVLAKKRAALDYNLLPKWYEAVCKLEFAERRDFLLLAIRTGLRSNDLKTLRWEHVHLDQRRIHLPKPKGGTRRAFDLPLSDQLVALLTTRKQEHAASMEKKLLPPQAKPWVFGSWSESGHIVEGHANVEGVEYVVHELRNTFATVAQSRAGVPQEKVAALLNHGGKTITDRYTGRPLEDLRGPMQKISDAFEELFQQPTTVPDNVVPLKRKAKG